MLISEYDLLLRNLVCSKQVVWWTGRSTYFIFISNDCVILYVWAAMFWLENAFYKYVWRSQLWKYFNQALVALKAGEKIGITIRIVSPCVVWKIYFLSKTQMLSPMVPEDQERSGLGIDSLSFWILDKRWLTSKDLSSWILEQLSLMSAF